VRVSQDDNKPGSEPRRREFDAGDLRRSDDVSGNSNDKKVAQALVEDDFNRYPGVRTTQDDRKRVLSLHKFGSPCVSNVRLAAPHAGREAAVALSQAFDCFSC